MDGIHGYHQFIEVIIIKVHSILCLFLSSAFLRSHLSNLTIISVISNINVKMPVTSDKIRLNSVDFSKTHFPMQNPVKKPMKVSVIKPKPNAMTKLNSSFSFKRQYCNLFEKPSTCSVILLYFLRSTLALIASRFSLLIFSRAAIYSLDS